MTPNPYQVVPANPGIASCDDADAVGPAWLHSTFGETIAALTICILASGRWFKPSSLRWAFGGAWRCSPGGGMTFVKFEIRLIGLSARWSSCSGFSPHASCSSACYSLSASVQALYVAFGSSYEHRTIKSAAANRRPAGQSDDSDNLAATVAADRAFPAAVAELGR